MRPVLLKLQASKTQMDSLLSVTRAADARMPVFEKRLAVFKDLAVFHGDPDIPGELARVRILAGQVDEAGHLGGQPK